MNANKPAFPQSCAANEVGTWLARDANIEDDTWVSGMSKREYFAIKIMQGMCANPNPGSSDENAKGAVYAADLLLAELEK